MSNIFGWSYPPGAASDPFAPYNEVDPPESYHVVLDFFSAENEAECQSSIYKNTSCGASLLFIDDGIIISSIVEGCDFGTATYPLYYADNFTSVDIQARIDAVEKEADDLWDWANRPCDKNGKWRTNGSTTMAELGVDAPYTSLNYRHFNQLDRSA